MRASLGILLAFVAVAAGVLALFWLYQRRLIYLPLGGAAPPAARFLPAAIDASLRTEDGLSLGAWFVPPTTREGATVIVFNGNAGHRASRAPIASAFAEAGFGVLLFDYRGYGGNAGSPDQEGLILDGLAARRWLEERDDVDAARIVYYGESLGAAVAMAVAARAAPRVLILRSPFTSMVEVGRLHYPWLPVRLLLEDRWPSIDLVAEVEAPLLIIAGTHDEVVPFEHSLRLYEAARQDAKEFLRFEGLGHNDAELIGSTAMQRTFAFLERHGALPTLETLNREDR